MTRAALVTGSSRGIGLATALALAERGFAIAVNGPEDDAELDAGAERVAAAGVPVVKLPGDVSAIDGHEALLERAETALGPLTTLVNNAGVPALRRGDLLDVSEASYDRCMAVNAKAPFFLSQAFARRLLARPRAENTFYSLIAITSVSASAVSVERAEYCVSKAAAAMIAQAFAVRLGRDNVAVYDVRPGIIDTAMTRPALDRYRRRIDEQGLTLLPRIGQPHEVASVVATLASGALPYTTGQVIAADGGLRVERL